MGVFARRCTVWGMSICCLLVSVRPARLDALLLSPADATELISFGTDGTRLDLDKAWGGLSFLLDGLVWAEREPLADAVFGGTPLDEADDSLKYSYGPPRYFRSAEVEDIAAALERVDRAALVARCDQAALDAAHAYPQGWVYRGANAPAADWLMWHFDRLVAFYRRAADEGSAVLLDFV